ncbi:MAG: hypothetical protein AAB500_01990 [Patescibacteria group bacterium]
MRKIIHKLRQKPEEHRRSLMHLAMIVFAVILFAFWTWSFGGSISSPETASNIEEGLAPFSVLKTNIIDGYKSLDE